MNDRLLCSLANKSPVAEVCPDGIQYKTSQKTLLTKIHIRIILPINPNVDLYVGEVATSLPNTFFCSIITEEKRNCHERRT